MAYKFQLRSDTAANWTLVNPILLQGEPGYEIDTKKIKYGDGTTRWNALAYFVTSGGGSSGSPAGPAGAVQFNNAGAFGGSAGLIYDGANLSVAGAVVPTANIVYDLGSPTAQWKDLWLSGNTIYLGNTTLETNANGGLSIGGANVVTTGNGATDFSDIVVTGNIIGNAITANNLLQAGNILTSGIIANGSVTAASLLVTGPFMAQQDVFFGTMHATELLLSGPMVVNGDLTTTGNLNAQNVVVTDLTIQAIVNAVDISASGNITSNTLATQTISTADIQATGTIQAGLFVGDGSQLTNLPISYSNANVASYLPTYTGDLAGSALDVRGSTPTTAFIKANTAQISIGKEAIATITVDDAGIQMVGNVSSTGNITTDTYFIGNGAFLTGIPTGNGTSYGNGDVQNYLPTYSGDLNPDNVTAAGNVQGQYILGNGAFLTGISGGNANYSNANVAAYLPGYGGDISVVTLSAATVSATGNIGGQYILGNGAFLTGIAGGNSNYSNANVANFLPVYSGDLSAANILVTDSIEIIGDITSAGNISLEGSSVAMALTDATGNGSVTTYRFLPIVPDAFTPGWNVTISGYTNPAFNGTFPVLTTGANSFTVASNTVGSVGSSGAIGVQTVGECNIETIGNVMAEGNVSGHYFLGNGAFLTGLDAATGYSNANVEALLPVYSGNLGDGNGYIYGNGAFLTGIVAGSDYSNANVANYLPTYTGALAGATAYVGGNNPGDYFLDVAADHVSLGMFAGQTVSVGGSGIQIAGTGGVTIMGVAGATVTLGGSTSGEIQIANNVSASGSITAASFVGDGSGLTNLPIGDYSNANVANYLPTDTTIISILGSIDDTNANVANTDSNVANVVTALASTDSNVANAFIAIASTDSNVANVVIDLAATNANVSNLASEVGNLAASTYSNANVADYLPTYTGNLTADRIGAGVIEASDIGTVNIVATNNISSFGNVVADSFFIGNGSMLTGLPAGYSNADVAAYLPTDSTIIAIEANIATLQTDLANTNSNVANTDSNVANVLIDIASTNSNVANVIIDLAATNSNVANTDSNVANAFTAISSTDSNVANVVTALAATDANVANAFTAISATDANVANAFTAISATDANVANVVIDLASTNSNVANAFTAISATDANVANVVIDLASTNSNVANTNSNVANVVTALAATDANVANAFTAISATDSNVANAFTAIAATDSNVANAFTAIAATDANVANVIIDLASTNSNVANTNSNVATITAEVANIQSEIGNLTAGSYSNANVDAYLPVYTGNIAFNSANGSSVGAGNLVLHTNVIAATTDIVIDPLHDGNPLTGDVTVLGNLSVTGNLTFVDVTTAVTSDLQWVAANTANTATAASGGGLVVGPASAPYATWLYDQPANSWLSNIAVTAPAFIGDGAALGNITGANVTGQVANATVAGTVYSNAQPNITSVGTLTELSASGNIVGANLVATSNIYIGNTPFVRTLTVGRATTPVTLPMASNNSFNVLTMSGNVTILTT